MAPDVLLVDDSTATRKILQRLLRQTGIPIGVVHEAGNGLEALETLKKVQPGLVLTALNMPGMDGFGLLAAIRESGAWHQIPVMIVTAEGSERNVAQALLLGAAGYVRKPFTADQIKEKLCAILPPAAPR